MIEIDDALAVILIVIAGHYVGYILAGLFIIAWDNIRIRLPRTDDTLSWLDDKRFELLVWYRKNVRGMK